MLVGQGRSGAFLRRAGITVSTTPSLTLPWICHPRSGRPSICSAMDVVSPSVASTARTCAMWVASERSSQR
jgi:hypothetical protein